MFHYPEPPAITPEQAAAIRAINRQINELRNRANRTIGDAVAKAMAEFHAATGLHLISVNVKIMVHHDGQEITATILNDVHARHNLEPL